MELYCEAGCPTFDEMPCIDGPCLMAFAVEHLLTEKGPPPKPTAVWEAALYHIIKYVIAPVVHVYVPVNIRFQNCPSSPNIDGNNIPYVGRCTK